MKYQYHWELDLTEKLQYICWVTDQIETLISEAAFAYQGEADEWLHTECKRLEQND